MNKKNTLNKELKYYGIHACLELFKMRPKDVIRVYLTKSNLSKFSLLLKWLAINKKAYHIVNDSELCKITDSTHHEGICILALEKKTLPFKNISFNSKCLLFLDGIANPHNLGSLIRTCVHFEIKHIIGEKNKLPLLSPSACRIAKGGIEHVSITYLNHLNELKILKEQGFSFIATDSNEKKAISLYNYSFPSKSLIILGSEDSGISDNLLNQADIILKIPGTDIIESLNVSVSTGLFLGEYWRQKNNYQKK